MRLFIDKPGGIDVEDCAAVSRQLSRVFEVEGIEYVALRFDVASLPHGYHRAVLEADEHHDSLVVAAPQRCYQGDGAARWGVFLPLYALRSQRDWGIADLTDLGALLQWTRGLGGDIVATLPLHAAFLDEPFEPSPYAPASRLFWNELYLDVTRIPELERSVEARSLVESAEIRDRREELRGTEFVDLREALAVKRRLLEPLCRALHAEPSSRRDAFARTFSTG